MLLLYILWDDWQIFMISRSNEQLQQGLEYTLLKPDCHSCGILKMQYGREDNLEERYAIKFSFKLGKNVTETHGMLQTEFGASCMNGASDFEWHERFKKGRESVRDDERCGRSKEVNTPVLMGQRGRIRVRVTMLRFYGGSGCDSVGSVQHYSNRVSVFPPGQCSSLQFHPCHRLFDQDSSGAGRPAFARPCVGVHKSTSLMSSSLLLQQCPACLVRLTWIVFVIGGRWPYSGCLVGCWRQDLFRIARSILV